MAFLFHTKFVNTVEAFVQQVLFSLQSIILKRPGRKLTPDHYGCVHYSVHAEFKDY